MYLDVNDTGYGTYVVEHSCHIAQGQWFPQEAKLSSTWRELRAVLEVLQSLTTCKGSVGLQIIQLLLESSQLVVKTPTPTRSYSYI